MMLRIIYLVAIWGLAPTVASADDMMGIGPGTMQCKTYLAMTVVTGAAKDAGVSDIGEQETNAVFYAWAEGFMTALNIQRTDGNFAVLNAKGAQYSQNVLYNYCSDHLDGYFVEAVKALYASLPVRSVKN